MSLGMCEGPTYASLIPHLTSIVKTKFLKHTTILKLINFAVLKMTDTKRPSPI